MRTLYIIAIALLPAVSFGQQWPYKLTALSAPYSDISNAVSLNNGQVWTIDSIFKIPLTNFNFIVDGSLADTIYVQAARGILFDLNYVNFLFGYSTVYGGTNGSILVDKGSVSGLSPISYKFDGLAGAQSLSIEFKNAGYHPFFCTDTSTFVNYQIRLFEADDHIEIHYGPSLLQGVLTGFLPFVSFKCYGDTGFYMSANPNNPTAYWCDMTQPNYSPLSSNPSNGIIYKIEIDTLFSPAGIHENRFERINIYPNPGIDLVTIQCSVFKPLQNAVVSIYSIEGKCLSIQEKTISTENEIQINITDLKPGLYFIKVIDNEKIYSGKIIKGVR